MKMILPTLYWKEQAIDFIDEFFQNGESVVNGSGELDDYLVNSSYEKWLEKLHTDIDIANVPSERVPAITYFYVRENDNRIIGIIDIRLALNYFLRSEGGHIGYSVRPTERRKHYAVEMLKKALNVCKRIGINSVIVTCDKKNIASARTIKSCGGELDSKFYSETYNEIIQRYIIKT